MLQGNGTDRYWAGNGLALWLLTHHLNLCIYEVENTEMKLYRMVFPVFPTLNVFRRQSLKYLAHYLIHSKSTIGFFKYSMSGSPLLSLWKSHRFLEITHVSGEYLLKDQRALYYRTIF